MQVSTRILPHTKIRPGSGWQALNLRQVWQFRDLALAFAARDIKLRYRQTALGIAWVVLQPLIAAGIFSFIFGKVAQLDTSFVFSYTGMLGWTVFSSILTKSAGCLVQNAGLISKVAFPRLVLPASTIFSTLLDFAVALAMFAALAFVYKVKLSLAIALLPAWLLLFVMLAAGCGLFASALMVNYRDVQHILPVLTSFLLYASPVGYPVPERYRAFFELNPLTGLLEAFRWSLLGGVEPDWKGVLYSAAVAVIALLGGAFAFRKMERKFADVI